MVPHPPTLGPFCDDPVLYEDEALVLVDKPAGVVSQGPRPGVPEDLPARLREHLAVRGGVDPSALYLGIHQRLDRDTSGVLLYTRAREANAAVARQLEGRSVEKEYLAVVRGFSGGDRVLRHHLAPGRDGRVVVARRGAKGAREAVTRVAVVGRSGPRALLRLHLETGRTHQVRAQLAAEGCPIVGDRLYGGAPGERLCLHSARLSLAHPLTGRPLTVEAPIPAALEAALASDGEPSAADLAALGRALRVARDARYALFRGLEPGGETTAFRWLNDRGDGVRGLCVDVYGAHLVAHFYDDEALDAEDGILGVLDDFGFEGVYVKRRPKQANELVDPRRADVAPPSPARGRPAPDPLPIREGGLPFSVRLGDGLSTGLFLEQRDNRALVRSLAPGARVLNLFAYTCGFSLAAAAGGARRTVSVDVSAPSLERGREALEGAGLAGGQHAFLRGDVFAVLERLARQGERFDLVVLDPPTYSTTRRSRFRSGADVRDLAALVYAVTAPGGRVLACTNDSRLGRARFRRLLHEGAKEADREVAQMKDLSVPVDFPGPVGAEGREKSVLVTLV